MNTKLHALQLTVAAVVEQRGRFLVVEERVDGRRVINQPAGHVESGEPLREAIVRETREETGWKFTPKAINGLYLWQHPRTGDRYLRIVFCGSCSDHDSSLELDEGIIRTLWLSHQELVARQNQLRSPMVVRAIDDYMRGIRYPRDMFQQLELEQLATRASIL